MFGYKFTVIDNEGDDFGLFKNRGQAQVMADALSAKFPAFIFTIREI